MRDEEGYLEAGDLAGSPIQWHSRDEEGYLEAGDLGGGAYGAMEGDLGYKLRPLAGFGRDLGEAAPEPEEDEIWDGVVFTPEVKSQTAPGAVVYEFSTWRQM